MKFLLDSTLSHRVAQLLRDSGVDAAYVRDYAMQHATYLIILDFARQHLFVLVSEDTDFGELLAQQRTVAPSFVLLRTYEPMTPDEQVAVLLANLPRVRDDLDQGQWHSVKELAGEHRVAASDTRTAGPVAVCTSRIPWPKLAVEWTREAQRLEKELEDAGIKISSVATDILGVSGRAMLSALIEGERDVHVLAEMVKARMRSKWLGFVSLRQPFVVPDRATAISFVNV